MEMKKRWKLFLVPFALCSSVEVFALNGTSRPSGPTPGAARQIFPLRLGGGFSHTCTVRPDGSVRCWGDNAQGQLGDGASGATHTSRTPVFVNNLNGAVNLAAGEAHTCVTRSDGTAQCWGTNVNGQIGDGTTTQRTSPVQVTSLTSAVVPAGGRRFSCAVRSDGTARCWGNNAFGQLGNGTTASSLTPVAVSNLTFTFAVAAGEGGSHTCALRANRVPSCWGLNSSGQLGDGTTTNRPNPVPTNSFAANIDPVVDLLENGRVAEVVVFVQCEAGQHVHIDVALKQDGAFGDGGRRFRCTGRLESYPVLVYTKGRGEFYPGPAEAQMSAEIRERRVIIETLEWSRRVNLVLEGEEPQAATDDKPASAE